MKKIQTIHWSGSDTRNICHWYIQADSMMDLYNLLVNNGIISIVNGDPYDIAKVEKEIKKTNKWKSYNEFEECIFKDETINNPCEFYTYLLSEMEDLSDEELEQLILSQNGNAYYQSIKIE